MSYQVYQKAQQSTETPSQIEYRLFVQVTNAMISAQDNSLKGKDLMDVLDWNRRVWSTLSTDCGAKGNGLPDQLRAGIISLAIWVSKHSSAVMRGEEPIQDLININRTIMEGLAAQANLQKQAAAAEDAETQPPASVASHNTVL
jgi:flagellar protein FlaF